MSISQIKALTWLGASALFVYVVLFAVHFHFGLPPAVTQYVWFLDPGATREKLNQGPSIEQQKEALGGVEAPPPEIDDLVDYDRVRATFKELNWTGKETRPVVVEAPTEAEPEGPPVVPVEELLRIQHIRYDSADPAGCLAFVKYIAPDLATAPPSASQLYVDSRLPAPHDDVRVAEIRPGEVVFGFDDEERETEALAAAEYGGDESYIAVVGEGVEPLRPAGDVFIPRVQAPVYRPKQTTLIGKNRHRLGTEDMDYIGQNWQEILSREVRTRRHRDPRSGKYDGIEVSSIAPGSVAARHGVAQGDILKSINGHPVSSKPEAIKFVKTNDDQYDRWEVVIERLGKEVTIVYEEPLDG